MEKVLLTGATGFVGSFLAKDLVERGYVVYVTLRKSSDLQWIKDLPLKHCFIDLSKANPIKDFLEENHIDAIIHNAGLTRHPEEDELNRINAGILKNIIEAINTVSYPIKKLIYISSLAAYGSADNQQEGIVRLDSTPKPLTAYGRSKLLAEGYLKDQVFPYLILRPTAVYGPREKDLLTLFKTINNRLDISIGKGQKLTFIYVKDLSYVIVESLKVSMKHKAYFISDTGLYDSSYFSSLIAKCLNKSVIKIVLPSFIVKWVCNVNDVLGKIFKYHPLLNSDKYNEISAKSWSCDADNIWDELNSKPKYDLAAGVEETVAWYKSYRWL